MSAPEAVPVKRPAVIFSPLPYARAQSDRDDIRRGGSPQVWLDGAEHIVMNLATRVRALSKLPCARGQLCAQNFHKKFNDLPRPSRASR